jgi:hypothetical protein
MAVKTKTPAEQVKYMIVGQAQTISGVATQPSHVYGPFDTEEAAGKTADALLASGALIGAEIDVIWTCQTARTRIAQANQKAATPEPESIAPAKPKRSRAKK